MKEVWKPVVGYEDRYAVSNLGRVKSIARVVHDDPRGPRRKDGGPVVRRDPERILGQWLNSRGYLRVNFTIGGNCNSHVVHRMVCEAFHGPPPFKGAFARHLDDDRANNAADNLAWGTHADNTADGFRNGVFLANEHHPRVKLSDRTIRNIRTAARRPGATRAAVARRFGVSPTYVSEIVLDKARRAA